ncbi:MAG: hypothetical protein AAGD13_15245 [Pseudomonadota bacterium]
MTDRVRSVLFVCTGNVFRSLTAERALLRALGPGGEVRVSSAGTDDVPGLEVRSDVAAHLASRGLDVSDHRRRTLTPRIVSDAGLVIAMNSDHRRFLDERHGIDAPLYEAAIGGPPLDMPDVNDLFEPHEYFTEPALQHVRHTIDRIIDGAPLLARRLKNGTIRDRDPTR